MTWKRSAAACPRSRRSIRSLRRREVDGGRQRRTPPIVLTPSPEGDLPVAIRVPPLSVDDQDYYPLHEENDLPETPPHEAAARYARDAIAARFPDSFVTGSVCIYWEPGNTKGCG